MRCIIVEAETREDVMKEMEERMREIEKTYNQRLMSEVRLQHSKNESSTYSAFQVERSDRRLDAKIDMLHQAGLFSSPQKHQDIAEESEESDEIEDEVGSSGKN